MVAQKKPLLICIKPIVILFGIILLEMFRTRLFRRITVSLGVEPGTLRFRVYVITVKIRSLVNVFCAKYTIVPQLITSVIFKFIFIELM